LEKAGYQPAMKRTLRSFTPFAIAFSFTSITTGLFTTYGFALNTAGPAGIWMWVVAGAGQVMVALILAQLTAHIPLSGYSYQGGSRLATPRVGWWFGWISYVFLAIVVVSVDYVLVTQALIPLFSLSLSTTGAIWMTVAVILYRVH
jgi:amino acid transporter